MSTALELAEQMATQPTRGFAFAKRAFAAAAANTLDAQLGWKGTDAGGGQTHDYKEGVAAFLAKRARLQRQ